MLCVLPPTNQTCFATNQVVTSYMSLDRVNLRVSHSATHGSYVTCCRTRLPWTGTTRNMYRFCRKKSRTTLYFLQQIFATCSNLICCKTGLNMVSKTRNIAANTPPTGFAAILQKTLHVFFAHFTVPLWHRAHCTCVPATVKFRLQFYLLMSNFLCFVM